jgi:hypothetical protein
MSPAIDLQEVQRLLDEGLSQREIARRTGIPRATLYDRLKRLERKTVQRPVQRLDTGAVSSADTGAVQRLDRLEAELEGLCTLVKALVDRVDRPPVQTPVQITALPPFPLGKAVRWNLWILDAIRDEVAALATQRGLSPSQLVQELLWKALTDLRSSAQ